MFRWWTSFAILVMSLLVFAASRGFGMAPIWGSLELIPPDAASQAFTAAGLPCQDGQNAPGVTTLPAGETATGVFRSRPFDCPAKMSFWLAGASRTDKNCLRLVDDATSKELRRQAPPGEIPAHPYAWDLADVAGRRVRLELVDEDTSTSYAWIALCRLEPEVARLPRVGYKIVTQERDTTATGPVDWAEAPRPATEIFADGVPFLQGYWWNPRGEGESFTLDGLNVEAGTLDVLGCVNSVDQSYANWGSGNGHENYFVGDRIGTLSIKYQSGQTDAIPLVFGYTVWWRENYNVGYAPFKTDPKDQALLDRALCVANGLKGGDEPYYISIALRQEPVAALRLEDNPDKVGYPVVRGLTLKGVNGNEKNLKNIDEKRFKWFSDDIPSPISGGSDLIKAPSPEECKMLEWQAAHTIQSADPLPASRQKAIDAVARRLYTYADEITPKFIAKVKPDTPAKDFAGPKVRFSGPAEADLLTNIYYDNAADLTTRIGEDGMHHDSGAKSPNYMGCAGWQPDLQPYYDTAFTRQRTLVALSRLGFGEKVEKAVNYYDHWLMYYPKAFPQVQLGGKPVPGHWSVICNKPHIYYDVHRPIGWPTKYKTRDFGNPENDGHGLTMLSHWMAWSKQGRTKEWVEAHWEALNEAAEYIPWALDNPELSFSEHGLLYNESEGGMQKVSMFCDLPCWLGLQAYAEMADAAEHADKAARWRGQADRMLKAMDAYYPGQDPRWGAIWPREKTAEWGHAPLAPVFLGSQYWGYDVANRLPTGWIERTRNTYKLELDRLQPRYASPTSLGYAQAFITQSALLLDEMGDAAKLTGWMARLCFYPNLPHPYRVPESAVMGGDGTVWWRRGDLGNTYQQAEVVYTMEAMIGVDDLDTRTLKLMPRLPLGWTGQDVKAWPARALSGGVSKPVKLDYALKRDAAGRQLDLTLTADQPLDHSRVRLGPFPATATSLKVSVNGKAVTVKPEPSGDSQWAWLDLPAGMKQVRLHAEVE